jgi:hypothetical protein
MPAQGVHELNAQAPNGRRPTLQNMGLLRRVSHVATVTAEGSSNSDGGLCISALAHLEPAPTQATPQIVEESMAIEERRMIHEVTAASLAKAERREVGGEKGPLSKAHSTPDVEDYEDCQTLPDVNDETG